MEFYIRKQVNDIFENIKITILSSYINIDEKDDYFQMVAKFTIENSTGIGTYNIVDFESIEPIYNLKKIYDDFSWYELISILNKRIEIEFGTPAPEFNFIIKFMKNDELEELENHLYEKYYELYNDWFFNKIYPNLTIDSLEKYNCSIEMIGEYFTDDDFSLYLPSNKITELPEYMQDYIFELFCENYCFVHDIKDITDLYKKFMDLKIKNIFK